MTVYEYETKRGLQKNPQEAVTLESLLNSISLCEESKEEWVEVTEQLLNILHKALPSVEDSKKEGNLTHIRV